MRQLVMGYIPFIISILISINAVSQNRESKLINDNWQFVINEMPIDEIDKLDLHWKNIQLPHTWNNMDIQSGNKVLYGTAWYRRDLQVEGDPGEQQYFLRFEGVGQKAKVYVNHRYVGEHLGSYSAFAFNITDFLNADSINSVHVWVNNELADSYPKDNFLFGIYGGIYRNIRLIETGNIHIGICDQASTGVYINPKSVSADEAIIKITTMVKNDTEKKQSFTLVQKIFGDDGMVVAEQQDTYTAYPGGMVPFASLIQVDQPRLWNGRKDPFLYELETSLLVDGKLIDKVKQAYGFRYFEIDPDRGFLLNGQAYRLYGVCRHQEWQDLGNALLPVHHRTDMLMINELGVTSVRLAHYQQAEYIYRLADSLGILVWAEIPFVNGYNEGANGNAKQQLSELIKQNFNHPSIFLWGVNNEVIKGDVVMPAVNLSRELHDLAKQLDPNRFTVAVSNIWWVYDHPIHENTDLQGFNQYTGWYGGQAEDLEKWISKYHEKKPDIRISVSEYGAGGNIEHQTIDDLSKPDPTGQFFPEGYQARYHEVTWSAIERSPFIWASYVWNMFDFSVPEWDRGGIKGRNHKGLVTYDRKIKKDAYYWYMANWSEDDVLHLCGKRNSQRPKGKQSFKAYSNAGAPELLINGKSYGKMTAGINEKQYLLEDIKLREGDHTIEIRAEKAESKLRDSFILRIDNDKQ